MRKCVGNIELCGCTLKYYVFGSRSTGFGIEIKVTRIEKAVQIVSSDLGKVMDVAKKLRCGSVFPTNLSEIIEDEKFDDVPN
ncbi:DUF6514 family protein [Caproiciproducens galactitolivorans]|uniref:DUF6514 family protein n=1 Tax=Caproiciproducens galactitolivorans TaxID=642589 RepID=A0ABT4BU57_9FIRM|nr:DUF6514 family protein [Caproiciproducens galactitolivorans]MCY1714438.1 DUF6514 family protein [Caproiciproducens galactitolivorans]